MGLQVPGNHLLYPDKWINQLQALNGDGEIGRSWDAVRRRACNFDASTR
jgi:hypothetical protein